MPLEIFVLAYPRISLLSLSVPRVVLNLSSPARLGRFLFVANIQQSCLTMLMRILGSIESESSLGRLLIYSDRFHQPSPSLFS